MGIAQVNLIRILLPNHSIEGEGSTIKRSERPQILQKQPNVFTFLLYIANCKQTSWPFRLPFWWKKKFSYEFSLGKISLDFQKLNKKSSHLILDLLISRIQDFLIFTKIWKTSKHCNIWISISSRLQSTLSSSIYSIFIAWKFQQIKAFITSVSS